MLLANPYELPIQSVANKGPPAKSIRPVSNAPILTRMSVTTESSQLTVPELWTRTHAMFTRAIAAIGPLPQLAAIAQLTPSFRRSAVRWIALLEHIVRKLLLAEAAKLPVTPFAVSQPSSALGGSRARSNAPPRTIETSHPEVWSARFSFSLPRDERAVPESRAPRIRALWGNSSPSPPPQARLPRVVDPERGGFRLARRLEALRRVLKDPLPYAQRLARIMRRVVRAFPQVVHRYAYTGAPTGFYDPHDPRLSLDALSPVIPAPVCFSDSS